MGLIVHHRQFFAENAFTTFQTDAGTSPVADNSTDTITFTSSDASVTITGNSTTDTIDFTTPGAGDVFGPASAGDFTIARFDGTTGKLIEDSVVTLDDFGNADGFKSIKVSDITSGRAVVSSTGGALVAATTTSTEIGYVNGVTSAIQTQIDAKLTTATLTTAGDILYHDGTSVTRLPVGADNEVLTVDTALAGKINWEAGGAGAGDVVGPASSTDNAFVRFDSTTGKLVQNSTVICDDAGVITGVKSITGTGSAVSVFSNPRGGATNEAWGDLTGIGSAGNNTGVGSAAKAGGAAGGKNTVVGSNSQATSSSSSGNNVCVGYSAWVLGKTNSVAIGGEAQASQDRAVGIGQSVLCNGADSVAVGRDSTAGLRAIVLGSGATGNAEKAIVIGYLVSGGTGSTVVGSDADATGTSSIAYGKDATATGNQTTSIGGGADGSTSTDSLLVGYNTNSNSHNEVLCIGSGAQAQAANQCIIGGSGTYDTWIIGAGSENPTAVNLSMEPTGIGAGATNTQGGTYTFKSGASTGNAGGADIIWQTSDVGASGSVVQTQTTKMKLTGNGHLVRSVEAAITAGTTQTQAGGFALTKDINEVSTVATTNDTVVLPSAEAGMEIFIINNGANTLQIFPASGDNLGAGLDTATTIASGSNVTYVSYNATNWEVK